MLRKTKLFIKSNKHLYRAAKWLQTRPVYCLLSLKKALSHADTPETRCKASRITPDSAHSYFGYYDKCPWNSDGNYLLYLEVPFADRMPKPGEAASIGLVDISCGIDNPRYQTLGETRALSWQQGAMLQWLGTNPGRHVIYNDFENGHYISRILDIHDGELKKLPLPVYAVNSGGNKALTLNFDRLHYARPGYGYVAKECTNLHDLHPGDDGIRLMDLDNGGSELIISLDEIVNFKKNRSFDSSFHYFNHLGFNPSNKRFMFLHLWIYKNVRYSRLFTANCDGSDITCLSDHGMVSHFTWKDDGHILAWARQPEGEHYFLFKDRSNEIQIVGERILTEDGHPSYSPDQQYILTDTYPDKRRMRSLLVYDIQSGKSFVLGRFFAPFKFDGPLRCDFHPRWNRDGRYVCFDSVHEGYRAMYILGVLPSTNNMK